LQIGQSTVTKRMTVAFVFGAGMTYVLPSVDSTEPAEIGFEGHA
jgi:hypothetical protein